MNNITFIANGGLNAKYEIDIENYTIISGCRKWKFESQEELFEALRILEKESKLLGGE